MGMKKSSEPRPLSTALVYLLAFTALFVTGCTSLTTPEIKGVVVDAETGKPICDARIYVKWEKTVSGPGGQTAGGIANEVRLRTKEDGAFLIPAYTLRNYAPYPFGQGGTFYMVVYAHGYMFQRFFLFSESSFDYEKNLKEYSKPEGIILKLSLITNPRDWRVNIGEIPEDSKTYGGSSWKEVRNDYKVDEYRFLINTFGKQKWDRISQAELADAYARFGDFKLAARKLEELIEDNPEYGKYYLKTLEGYKKKAMGK